MSSVRSGISPSSPFRPLRLPVHSRPISHSREIHMPMPDGRKKSIEPLRGKEEAESHPKQEVPFPPFPSESDGPAALLIFAVRGGGGGGKIKKFRMPPRPPAVCPAVLPPAHISPDKSCVPPLPSICCYSSSSSSPHCCQLVQKKKSPFPLFFYGCMGRNFIVRFSLKVSGQWRREKGGGWTKIPLVTLNSRF